MTEVMSEGSKLLREAIHEQGSKELVQAVRIHDALRYDTESLEKVLGNEEKVWVLLGSANEVALIVHNPEDSADHIAWKDAKAAAELLGYDLDELETKVDHVSFAKYMFAFVLARIPRELVKKAYEAYYEVR